jgi:oligopeptide/dipeptide ABC transporter ATP-binding protein
VTNNPSTISSIPSLVDIRDLTIEFAYARGLFRRKQNRVRVLENFNLQVQDGETLGIVGESGCGKTTLANSLACFIRPTKGQILFEGRDIVPMAGETLRHMRREIQIIFQNPFNSLNPRMTVLELIAEPLVTHMRLTRDELKGRVLELLEEVGLGAEHLKRHPHELSGGQAQRVAVARALALNPKLLLLDEPTSALDVSVQAQVVNLLEKLQDQYHLTYLFISHGLGVVQHISDRIAVLYMGEVVELAPTKAIFASPQHPYTQALFSSTPIPDPGKLRKRILLEGNVPSLAKPPSGCRFHTRCPYVMDICRIEKPASINIGTGHTAACHLLTSATH